MPVVSIPTARIQDWPSFHDVFASTLGFPGYYGRNMDAWIDCLSQPESMTNVALLVGDVLTLDLGIVQEFRARCPEQYAALVECAAFVNSRRIERGDLPILALAYR